MPLNYTKKPAKKWPLIVDFHGRNGSSAGQWDNSQYYRNPGGQGYFVAYPVGCMGDGNHGGPPERAWEGAPYANKSCNDLLFVSDLVSRIESLYPIDSTRIYASGKSNGGGFVDTIACSTLGDTFAAFAMAAPALYTDTFIRPVNCVGKRPRPFLESHGTEDNVIPINGRQDFSTPNIARWTRRWAGRNGCDPDEDRNISFQPWGINTTYSCEGVHNIIQQYRINGLGHCWPSLVDNTDAPMHDGTCLVHTVDFTQEVLNFFARWTKVV